MQSLDDEFLTDTFAKRLAGDAVSTEGEFTQRAVFDRHRPTVEKRPLIAHTLHRWRDLGLPVRIEATPCGCFYSPDDGFAFGFLAFLRMGTG